ncbi:MAG TPA: sigma-70 family RNA polymerase sigma factor, partial [Pyrinomonadaceae bacterium]|nr:sigma-70 family RNA polymerase sigma factor [Pyrinomonadaceae bacterium]
EHRKCGVNIQYSPCGARTIGADTEVSTMPAGRNDAVDEEFIPTRKTLLNRLQSASDDDSWRTFFDTYWKLIYGVALRAGLSPADAEDVVQETVISVAKNIGQFRYDPENCSFKSWLMVVTRSRIANQFRRLNRVPPMHIDDGDDATSLLNRIPDKADGIEALWEDEWQKNIMDAAIRKAKRLIDPEQFQVFDFYVLKGWPVKKVAQTFSINVAQVYLIKHRISKTIKKEIKQLEAKAW